MADLDDLYREMILDHSRNPRNFRSNEAAAGIAHGNNPLCGDRVSVFVDLDGDSIRDISFQGSGCAVCTASASLMTQALKGATRRRAQFLFENVHHMLTDGKLPHPEVELGKLHVLEGVREFPIRVKCATLPWHTFHSALTRGSEIVSTE